MSRDRAKPSRLVALPAHAPLSPAGCPALGSVSGNSAAPPGGPQAPDGEQGSQWRPCPAWGGVVVEARVRPGRPQDWLLSAAKSARPPSGRPIPRRGAASGRPRPPGVRPRLSVLGSRMAHVEVWRAWAAGRRTPGWVLGAFYGLSWPRVLKSCEGA